MSLTESETLYAAIHESALNDLLAAFCIARTRHLVYGSPAFVPVTTAEATSMAPIAFPGVPGGIQWLVTLSIPRIDLFRQSSALPAGLVLSPGQFSAEVPFRMCIECRRLKIDPRPPPTKDWREPDDRVDEPPAAGDRHPLGEVTCFERKLFVVGHVERVLASTGEQAVALAVDQAEIEDIDPPEVEAFLECLLFMVAQVAFSAIRLPLRALRVDAFELALTVGPLIEDDQLKVRGLI